MFGTPKAPVSEAARLWIENGLQELGAMFGEERWRRAPVVLPTREFFPDQWDSPESGVEMLLQRVSRLLEIERERLDLEVQFDEFQPRPMIGIPVQGQSYAGLYQRDGASGRERIVVKLGAHSEPISVVAILSHELCHVLLLGDGKIERDRPDGEPLTDLLFVLLGFGIVGANAVFRTSHASDARGQSYSMRRQGYLSEAEIAYALALWTLWRGEPKPAWQKHLDFNPRAYFSQSLRYLGWREKRIPTR